MDESVLFGRYLMGAFEAWLSALRCTVCDGYSFSLAGLFLVLFLCFVEENLRKI